MNHLRLHFFLFSLMSLVATSALADETKAILPEKEEDIPVEFIPTLDTTISVGMRRLNNGPRVRFGNLGSMSQPTTGASNATGTDFTSHYYTDGYVLSDAKYAAETNNAGTAQLTADESNTTSTTWRSKMSSDGKTVTVYTQIPTVLSANQDGTYVPNTVSVKNADGTTTQALDYTWASTGRFLAYKDGQVRTWGTLNQSQIKSNGTVEMHADGVKSAGASLEADSSSSTGFEISIERRLGKRGRLDWGVSAGFNFAYINAKAAGVFPAYLVRTTDIYKMVDTGLNSTLLATAGGVKSIQPSGNAKDLDIISYVAGTGVGIPLTQYVDSTTTPLTQTVGGDTSMSTPLSVANNTVTWGTPTIVDTVMIHGNYQLKGAYLLAHVGPTFRYNLNDRWAVSGGVGLALAWSGTNFRATEFYNTWNDVPAWLRPDRQEDTTEYHLTESNATHKFTPGLYLDLNIEYWVTDRTGFYAGLTGQSIRKYNQSKLSERTATVEMGKNAGWTVGIRTRF